MHFRSMDRPPYLIGEIIAFSESDAAAAESVPQPFRRMEMFSYVEERTESSALDLTYHLAPWDEPIFQAIRPPFPRSMYEWRKKRPAFEAFRAWCNRNRIKLVSCRLPQDQLAECGFLEAQGFRFIELNYRPVLAGLGGFSDDPEISVCHAVPEDAEKSPDLQRGYLHRATSCRSAGRPGDRQSSLWRLGRNAFRHPDSAC